MPTSPSPLLEETLDEIGQALQRALVEGREAVHMRLMESSAADGNADIRHVYEALRARLAGDWAQGCERFREGFDARVEDRSGTVGTTSSIGELQLVEDDVVEWDIAVGNALQRLANGAGEDLSDFEQRLAMLGDEHHDQRAGDYGLAPAAAAAGLRQIVESIGHTLTERRSLLPALLAVLQEPLREAVGAANARLAEHGLNPAAARREAARARVAAKRADAGLAGLFDRLAQGRGGAAGGAWAGGAGGGAGFGGGTGGEAGGGAGGGIGGGLLAIPANLLASLDRLQQFDRDLLAGVAGAPEPVGGSALRAFRQAEGQNLQAIEAMMIDLVATIFDLIFQDGQVPDAIKALIGRLQIPLLKVAMSDRGFFSSREHPARAFLDAIARASVSLGKEIDREHPFAVRVKTLINRILEDFERNPQIFGALLPELQALIAAQEREADRVAEKSRRVAEQQEESDLAQIKGEEVFERIIKAGLDTSVPPAASDFLVRYWPLVLKEAHLDGGQGGARWTVALQTLTDLLWSLKPKDDAAERAELVKRLPGLLKRINACLDRVAVPAEARPAFLNCLMDAHSGMLKGGAKREKIPPAKADAKQPEAAPQPVSVVTRTVEQNGVEVESVSVDGRLRSKRPLRSSEIGDVRIGDWAEFKRRGVWLRVRLSWVSPARGVMLFTNPDTNKALSVTPEALALQLKSGDARVLGEGTLVDRVLEKALDKMEATRS